MAAHHFLAQTFLFEELTSEELDALAAASRLRSFARGETIFEKGDPGAACYVIETGQVKITVTSPNGKQITLALLGPGDLIGELALLDGAPRSADAVVMQASRLFELQRDPFLDFLHTHNEAAIKLLAALARRLRHTDEVLEDSAFLQVPARLAKVLLQLSEQQGEPVADGIAIHSHLTQAELAALAGTTRETVNRWLGFFQQRGFVQFDGGRIIVCRPEELRRQIY